MSNNSGKFNVRDSMSMSKGGFIPKQEQLDYLNRSQNTMHEISQGVSSTGTEIEISLDENSDNVERCKSLTKNQFHNADHLNIKVIPARRKSVELESPISNNL